MDSRVGVLRGGRVRGGWIGGLIARREGAGGVW